MKICPTCNMQLDDNAVFCRNCGTRVAPKEEPTGSTGYENGYYQTQAPAPGPSAWDHSAEFEAKDVAENKLLAMLIYLTGILGIALAFLARTESDYLRFHLRQGLKFLVVEAVLAAATAVLCWTLIVPFCAAGAILVLYVLRIISFFQVCGGKAVEPAILRSMNFLR